MLRIIFEHNISINDQEIILGWQRCDMWFNQIKRVSKKETGALVPAKIKTDIHDDTKNSLCC